MRRTAPAAAVALSLLALTGCGTESNGVTQSASPTPTPEPTAAAAVPGDATATSTAPSTPSTAAPTTTAAPNEPAPREQTTSTTLEAYNVLAKDMNGFFAAAEHLPPQKAPKDAEDLRALVDYDFRDGVTLVEYDDTEHHLCFTGPENTYLTLSEPADTLQRSLGTGDCNYDDGAVVLEVVFPDDMPGALVTERVIKGERLAKQIPALADFSDLINRSLGG